MTLPQRMTTTDFHQHLWPDEFRRTLERRRKPPRLRGRHLELPRGGGFQVDPASYSPENRLGELERAGLERAVVSLPPTTEPTPDLVACWHEEALQLARVSEGRILPLAYATADPAFPGAIVAAPLLGESADLLTQLEQQDQLVFVHPAAAPPGRPKWRTAGVAYPQQMLDAYAHWIAVGPQRWPRLRVVFALLAGGAAFHLERFARRGLDPRLPHPANIWLETSSYGERALELSFQTFGATRLVFGSDAPVDRVENALAPARGFGAALADALLVSNPLELLSPAEARWAA
jgi:6-methylsalicylate decarboxylase